MKKIIFFLIFITSHLITAQYLYQTEPIVRVRIINDTDSLKVIFNSDWELICKGENKLSFSSLNEAIFTIENNQIQILSSNGRIFLSENNFVLKSIADSSALMIKDVPYGVGWWWEGKEDRIYEGEIRIYQTAEQKIEVVVHLPIEQYLKGVVPYEIGSDSPPEALKAQAVAARSEAIVALMSKLYSGEHYDLTSDVECQVFSGNHKRTPNSDLAVDLTRGLILTENGEPINAYYASNCGGHSELIRNVWPDRPEAQSYSISKFDWEEQSDIDLSNEITLREWIFSNPDSYCNPNINSDLPEWSRNNFRWKREFTSEEITKMLSKENDFGKFIDIKILEQGTSGRAIVADFIFEKDTLEIIGELNIRQMFSPPLRSSCFVVDKTHSGFTIYGAGWGHGVGMCQSGAVSMANKGKTFEDILKHYYRNAVLFQTYQK